MQKYVQNLKAGTSPIKMPTASQTLRASPVIKPSDDAPPPRQSPGPNGDSSEDERQYMMLRHSDEEANGHDTASSASNGGGGGRRGGDEGGGGGSSGGSDDSGPHHIPKSPERAPVAVQGGPRSVSMRGRGPPASAPAPGHHPYHNPHHHHQQQHPRPPVPFRVGGPSIFPGSDSPGQRGSPPSYMRGVSEDANSLTSAYPYPPAGPPGPDYHHHHEPYPYDPAVLSGAPSWGSIDLRAMGTFDHAEDLHNAAAAGGYGSNGSAVITPAQTIRKGASAIAGYPGPGGATNNYFMYPPSSPIKAGPSPRGSPQGSPGFGSMLPPEMPSPRGSPRVEPEEDEVEETSEPADDDREGVRGLAPTRRETDRRHEDDNAAEAQRHQGSDEEGLTAEWLPPQSTKGRVRPPTSGANERVLVAPSAAAKNAVEPAVTVHVPPKAPGTAAEVADREARGASPGTVHPPQFLSRQPSHAPGSSGRPGQPAASASDTPPHYQPPLMVDTSASRSTDSSESPGHSLYGGRVQLVGGGIGRHEWDGGHPASSSSSGGGAHWSLVSRSRSMESGGSGSGRSPGRVGREGGGGSGEWEPPRPTRQPMVPPPGRPAAVSKSVSAPGSTTAAAASSGGYPASHDPYGMRPPPPHHHPGYYAGYDYYGGTKGGPPPPSSGTPPGQQPQPPIQKSYSSQSSSGGGGGSPPGGPPHHHQGYPQGYPPSSYSPAERQQPPHPSSASAYPGYPGYPPKSGAASAGYPYPGYHPSQYPHHPYSSYPQPQGPRLPPGSSHPGAYPRYPPHGGGPSHPPPPPPEDEDMDGPPAPHPLLKDYNPHRDSISIRPQFQNVKKTKAAKRTHPAAPHHGMAAPGSATGGPGAMMPHPGPYPPGAGMPGFNDGMAGPHGPGGAMQTPRRRRRRNPTEKAAAAAAMAAAAEAALKDRKEKVASDDRKNAAEAARAAARARHGGVSPDAIVVEGLSGPAEATIASNFSEEELKTLGSGDDEDIPAAKRAAMASAVALRAAAGGSPLEPPKSAAEVKFDIADPPSSPVCMPSNVPAIESATLMTENDVLCGRGGGTNSQMGNRRFRALVRDFQPTYLMAKRREKPRMARSVVLIVRNRGGRFLRRDEKSGRLYEVGDEKAEAKTSQALREGLDVRATKTAANTLMGSTEGSSKKRKTSPTIVAMQERTESAAVEAAAERSAKEGRALVGMGRAVAPPRPLPVHAPGFGNTYQGRSGPPAAASRPTRPPPPTRHGSAPHPSSRSGVHPSAAAGYYPPHYPRYDDPYYRSRYPPHHPTMAATASAAATAYDYGGPSHAAPPPPSSHPPPPPPPTTHHHHYHYAGGGGGGGTAGGYHYPGSYGGASGYGAPSPPRSTRKTPVASSSTGSDAAFSPPRGPRPPNVTPVVSRPKGIVRP